jgi:DNA-binding response OmpR family regulator
MKTVLLVEDDANLGAALSAYLTDQGYSVLLAKSVAEARASISTRPDVIVLDWMLPDAQGLDLLIELRRQGNPVPIIFLTAKSDVVDRVVGLEAGANDYMVKPFEPRELAARIRVQLRPVAATEPVLRQGEIQLDPGRCQVTRGGTAIELSPKEYLLLKLFMENPDRVFSREEILTRIWGYERHPSTRTVDTHMLQLRQKFGDALFETVRGFGYRLRSVEGDR